MARRTDPSADDWRNVEDAKKRKQIQDRLAQRARRQRLREAKNNAKRANDQAETQTLSTPTGRQTLSESQVASNAGLLVMPEHPTDMEMVPALADTPVSIPSPASSSSSSDSQCIGLSPFNINQVALNTALPCSSPLLAPHVSLAAQPHFPLNFYGALYINGQILGIPCSTVVPKKSNPVGPNVPLPLHPTDLQLITIHPTWIDRFPFPKMRNSLISLSGIIDEEEFVRDTALMPSFEIVPGRMPWDPRAWKILKPFAEKWGYLFFGAE